MIYQKITVAAAISLSFLTTANLAFAENSDSQLLQVDTVRWLKETGADKIIDAGGSSTCYFKKAKSQTDKDSKNSEVGFKYRTSKTLKGFSLLFFREKEIVYCSINTAEDNLPSAPGSSDDAESDPASGGAPMIIDDTGTVDKGHWEVISALTGLRDSITEIDPSVDINYGMSGNLQMHFLIPWDSQKTEGSPWVNGPGDAEIGAKYRFLGDANNGFSMVVYPKVELNLGKNSADNGLVEKGIELQVPLVIQERLGKYTVGGQMGYDFKPASADQILYGIIGGFNAAKRIQLLAEVAGNSDPHFGANEVDLNVGSRVKLNKHANLLLSVGHSLVRSGEPGQYFFYIGIQNLL